MQTNSADTLSFDLLFNKRWSETQTFHYTGASQSWLWLPSSSNTFCHSKDPTASLPDTPKHWKHYGHQNSVSQSGH